MNSSTYPYHKPLHHDHDHNCCHMVPPTYHDGYPISGHMTENAFAIIGGKPFIFETNSAQYGSKLSVSEQVYTRVVQRQDVSCINLDAKFDMTSMLETNTVLTHYLKQIISNNLLSLNGVLPVLKELINFKIYYSIKDSMGAEVLSSHIALVSQPLKYHSTDIVDYYLTSANNIAVTNINAMDYAGMYTLYITKVEAYCNVIDTYAHMTADLNPFYQFTQNNTKIAMQHDTISETNTDSVSLLASCDVDYSIPFQGNVTTKLKISFTAFMSLLIHMNNTFDIWDLFNDSVKETLAQVTYSLSQLTERVDTLGARVDALNTKVDAHITEVTSEFTRLSTTITDLATYVDTLNTTANTNITNNTNSITVLDTRVTALENQNE